MIARIQSLARNVLHRSRVERALDDELHGYLDELAADFRRRGMSDAEARRAARLELRGLDVVKESVRDVWLGRRLDTLRRDVQYSWRALRNRPGFTATAVLTLALGLGGATAVFSVINAVMFRPPPGIADPSRVVAIDRVINGATFDGLSFPALLELRAGTHAYAGIAAHVGTPLRLQRADGSRTNIIVDFATGNYFRVLGVRASLGRLLAPADAEVHDPRPLLVLNHDFWRSEFNGDSAVIGQAVQLNGAPFTIVGVAAAGFGGTMTGQHVEAWAPLPMVVATRVASASAFATDPKLAIYSVVARLAPDVTAAAAQRGLGSDSLQVVRSFGRDPDLRRDDAHYFLLLGSAVGLLLLLICANVAALSLLRTASRRHEFATRLALGASRAALARQVLVEAALLAVAATLLGGSTAALFVQHSSAVASQFGQVAFGVDGTVLSFAAAACAVTLIAVSVVPIARLGGVDPMTVLRSATAGRGRRVSPAQRGLVALQVAVSLVLVATASMIFRTFQRSLHSDPGFEPRGVGMVYFDPRVQGLDSVRTLAVLRELERATTANPEFASAAVATAAPLLGRGGTFTVFRDGEVPPVGASRGAHRGVPVRHAAVSPSYFATLRIPVIAGRTIGYDDGPGAGRVAVVSRQLAERMWGTHSAVGKYLEWPRRTGPPARMLVVGVVGDVKQSSLMDASEPMLYVSITQWPPDGTLLIARGRLGEAPMAALKRVLASVRPALDLDGTWTMSELVRQSVETQRIVSFWVGVAGLLAMVLSALGVYGVVAQVVRERMRELAVRCALGARPGQLVTVLMTEGLLLAGLGGVAGTVALVWTQSVVRRSLDGMAGVDPLVVAACVVLLCLAMALASYLPARRAAAVNPIDVLRQE